MGTHGRDLDTKETVEGYQMADSTTTRLFWAVATLALAWVVGLIGDCVDFGCGWSKLRWMGQFENKNKNETHGVILASELLGRCCQ